jgi:hypothetical protein
MRTLLVRRSPQRTPHLARLFRADDLNFGNLDERLFSKGAPPPRGKFWRRYPSHSNCLKNLLAAPPLHWAN